MKILLGLESSYSQIVLVMDADIPAQIETIAADKPDTDSASLSISTIAQQEFSGFSVNVTSHERSDKQFRGQVGLEQAEKVDDNRRWRGSLKVSYPL
jgi:hypothetical protein